MKNILFLGSKPIGYKALEFLIINSNKINCRVVGVLSNDNNLFGNYFSVKKLSAQHNIPIIDQLDDILNLEHIDVIISVQYHLILKEAHIRVAKDIAVNLHMAPLPEY